MFGLVFFNFVLFKSKYLGSGLNFFKTLILIGFSGGFRRSELVAITRDDVEFVNEGVKIFVKKSKSDQAGEGMTKAIPSFKHIEYCPVDHLKNWMIENKDDLVFPISDKNVALIIKKYALSAGLDEKKIRWSQP